MLNIAICDDNLKELHLAKNMCDTYIAFHPEYDIRASLFQSSADLKLRILDQEQYDIVLLDIYMPEVTGLELARLFREKSPECQIIFLTTSTAHAVEAFSLHAAHYLLKPFTQEQFTDALSKAAAAVEKRKKEQLSLKTAEGVYRLLLADILYAESDRHQQCILLTCGQCLQVRITSTRLYELLSYDKRFYKCGSTYIINLDRVEAVTSNYINFENGLRIPMLRRQYKELLNRYTRYALEGI